MPISKSKIERELKFRTSRSGGKGGQHVNKVESRVEVLFDIEESRFLTENQKKQITERLKNQLIRGVIIRVVSETYRSQYKNKKEAIDKLFQILVDALKRKVETLTTEKYEGKDEIVALLDKAS